MKKYLLLALVIIIVVVVYPFNHHLREEGVIVYNEDKTIVFFVQMEPDEFDCKMGSKIEREGFQFLRTIQNSNQLFKPNCDVLANMMQNGKFAEKWYFGICTGSFSYEESFFNKVLAKFNQQTFSLYINHELFMKLRYNLKKNIDNVQITKIE